ncbi:MAG TPA: hypothetical protein VF035_08835 [Longimicrobiales bacterium]
MRFTNKVVLLSKKMYDGSQDGILKELVRRDTALVCVTGVDAAFIEDMLDEFAATDDSGAGDRLITTSHTDDSLEQVLAFANAFDVGEQGELSIIEI